MIDRYVNKVTWGDCLQVMKRLPDKCVDLVVTDPPYGIKRDKGFGGFGGFGKPIKRIEYNGNWDNKRPDKICFDEVLRISKNAIIFGGNFFSDYLPQSNHWISWDKLQTMPTFGDCELLWTSFDRNSVKKYIVEWNGLLGKEKQRFHATQKPEKLLMQIINDYSTEGDLILDPFAGSFTTVIACIRLKRNFIAIEKELRYCKIGLQRIKNEVSQLKLF